MSKIYFTIAMVSLLSACGGGGSDSPAVATTASNTSLGAVSPNAAMVSSTPPAPAPGGIAVELASMPVVSDRASKLSTPSLILDERAHYKEIDVTFNGFVDLSVKGYMNKFWIDAKDAGGAITVSGNENTFVFRPGVETTVTVTGGLNQFIMAEGSLIKIEGSSAPGALIQYYKATPIASPVTPP